MAYRIMTATINRLGGKCYRNIANGRSARRCGRQRRSGGKDRLTLTRCKSLNRVGERRILTTVGTALTVGCDQQVPFLHLERGRLKPVFNRDS